MDEAPFTKRRKNPRFSFSADAEVTQCDGTLTLGRLSQLGARGCYIDTPQPIPVGTELHLHVSDGMSSCELPGKVLYINSRGGVGIFGIGPISPTSFTRLFPRPLRVTTIPRLASPA